MFCVDKDRMMSEVVQSKKELIAEEIPIISVSPCEIVENQEQGEDSVMSESHNQESGGTTNLQNFKRLIRADLKQKRELSSSRQAAAPASGFATSQAELASHSKRNQTPLQLSWPEPLPPLPKKESPFLIRIPFADVDLEF